MLLWTKADTVAVCKECGEDIWPAAVILRCHYGTRKVWGVLYTIETLCEDCGKIYEKEAYSETDQRRNS